MYRVDADERREAVRILVRVAGADEGKGDDPDQRVPVPPVERMAVGDAPRALAAPVEDARTGFAGASAFAFLISFASSTSRSSRATAILVSTSRLSESRIFALL